MDERRIAERVANTVIAKTTEYQEFFKKKLKEHGVSNPSELKGDAKKKFFDDVDKNWDAKEESD